LSGSRAVAPAVSIELVSDSAGEGLSASPEHIGGAEVGQDHSPRSAERKPPSGPRAGGETRPTAHLYCAARTLEQILGELYPEHDWVVTVRQGEGPDRQGDATAPVGLDEPGVVGKHPGAVAHRDAATTADGHNDHGLDQAA
jgi:hypothetical protein